MASVETPSTWAIVEFINLPVLLSKKRIFLSSPAVIVTGIVGCDNILLISPGGPSSPLKIVNKLIYWAKNIFTIIFIHLELSNNLASFKVTDMAFCMGAGRKEMLTFG
jgi:hypothetical protein